MYEEGLARFCTQKYKRPTAANLDASFMHLTNYSVNKRNTEHFVAAGRAAAAGTAAAAGSGGAAGAAAGTSGSAGIAASAAATPRPAAAAAAAEAAATAAVGSSTSNATGCSSDSDAGPGDHDDVAAVAAGDGGDASKWCLRQLRQYLESQGGLAVWVCGCMNVLSSCLGVQKHVRLG